MKSMVLELAVLINKTSFEIMLTGESKKIMLLNHELQPNFRPYIHPIRPLDGSFVITENSPAHHPWQHGLYFGLHGVNGSDFWLDSGKDVGSFQETKLDTYEVKSDSVDWVVSTNWVHHEGVLLFKEIQRWSLVLIGNHYFLDVQFKLLAQEQITIDQCKYGGLFLRMPWRNDVNSQAINSNGEFNKEAEQKMAKWVDLTMKWPEHPLKYGFLIFENPKNVGFPNYWRVDGNFGVGLSNVIKGPTNLRKGEELLLAYRLIVHEGVLDQLSIEKLYQLFERENHV